jgi:GTP-binding protein HflX
MVIKNLPFLITDTVGFIRKLPHDLVESFKSTLDEVRESDLLVHVVDISHPDFEEQISIVQQTLGDINANGKATIVLFNKIDAYTYVKKEEDDLTPISRENLSLEDLKKTWMALSDAPALFISALEKQNVEELKEVLYKEVKRIHMVRYPYNDFLFEM